MKKIFFVMLLFSSFIQAQNLTFEQIKLKLNTANSETSFKELSIDLEKIAEKEPNSWFVNYYTAYSLIELANFSNKKVKDQLCDKADVYLEKAMKLKGSEVENLVLKAYLLSARIKANPMFRGASMGKESKEFLNKALALDPNNPRANLVRGMGIFNTPSIFGGGKTKAKPYLDIAKTNFDKAEYTKTNMPSWGNLQLNELLNDYK